MINVNEAR